MSGVVVVGSGKRVREAALPALDRLADTFPVRAIFAKHAKTIVVGGVSRDVRALDTLGSADLAGVELVYLAVTKDVVPRVLAKLVDAGVAGIDLLIDTPVVRFKHYRHVDRVRSFRNAWVSEDCTALPWLETVERASGDLGALGPLEHATFDRSAYAYHGVATAKALLGSRRVTRAWRHEAPAGSIVRELVLANGRRATLREPRDYAVGHVVIRGARGSVSDRKGAAELPLEPIVAGRDWTGFRIGDVETRLDDDEIALLRGGDPGASVTARMDDLKRVGFLRLLRGIAAGRGAYPVDDAIDDMVVDYHLERIGGFLDNPFTSTHSALGRFLLRSLTRLGGG